jgi:hypothetical protein
VSRPPAPGAPTSSALVAPPTSEKDARQQKARRRHQGEAAENEERDATPDLLLKYPDTTLAIYEIFKTCVRNICKNT